MLRGPFRRISSNSSPKSFFRISVFRVDSPSADGHRSSRRKAKPLDRVVSTRLIRRIRAGCVFRTSWERAGNSDGYREARRSLQQAEPSGGILVPYKLVGRRRIVPSAMPPLFSIFTWEAAGGVPRSKILNYDFVAGVILKFWAMQEKAFIKHPVGSYIFFFYRAQNSV